MRRTSRTAAGLLFATTTITALASPQPPPGGGAGATAFFEREVRPLLLDNCVACHGKDAPGGGIRLDAPLSPANAKKVLEAVRYDGATKMPPSGKLSAPKIAALDAWVKSGAYYPPAPIMGSKSPGTTHWAFQKVKRPAVPTLSNPVLQSEWVRNPIDSFIAKKLESKGLTPNVPASKRELIRRVTYDLTGLPPTPEEVEAFAKDTRPDAYERLVDHLLYSPHYGEKWGRQWLDLVRYAETNSYERDNPKPNAFRYRDYVIKALNADKPYDRFITEQLAGDELPYPTAETLTATGFYRLGIWDDEPVNFEQARYDGLDDMVTTVGQAFLGLTFDCARCHDHKIDPILQTDYYKLVSFLSGVTYFKNGGDSDEAPLFRSPAERRAYEKEVARLAEQSKETKARLAALDESYKKNRDATLFIKDLSEIRYRLYPGTFSSLPDDFDRRAATQAGTQPGGLLDLNPRPTGTGFGLVLEAKLTVPAAGEYAFFLDSDDGARLKLDGKTVVERRESGGEGNERSGKVTLPAGIATLRLEYFESSGNSPMGLRVAWAGPGVERRPLSTAASVSALGLPAQLALDNPALSAERGKLLKQIEEQEKATPPIDKALVATEAGVTPPVTNVLDRGDALKKGEKIEPGFPVCLGGGAPTDLKPTKTTSGRRLALAKWIASPENPLTARVIVNRLWQGHFGRGIVKTPSDYGLQGARPTNPELLDWLASELVAQKWSMKAMHRLIVTSSAYRMSSRITPSPNNGETTKSSPVIGVQGVITDPDNELLWRQNPRRLAAEEVRDSLLAVAGNLNKTMFGPSVYPDIAKEVLAGQSIPGKDWYPDRNTERDKSRRSIYVFQKRSLALPLLSSFDLAESDRTTAARFASVQPMQALSLMNGGLANAQAKLLAARAQKESPQDFCGRVFALVTQRPPTQGEKNKLQTLLDKLQKRGASPEQARGYVALAALNLNEFLYLD